MWSLSVKIALASMEAERGPGFVEEEKERALEALADRVADDGLGKNRPQQQGKQGDRDSEDVVVYEDAVAAANTVGTRSLDSVRGGESIMEALDMVHAELVDIAEYTAIQKKSKTKLKARPPNPVMLGLHPYAYMMSQLKRVKQPDLEQALLILLFDYVVASSRCLLLSELGYDLELCCRASIFLLRCHFCRLPPVVCLWMRYSACATSFDIVWEALEI